jgi:hypothetical protein
MAQKYHIIVQWIIDEVVGIQHAVAL